MENIRTNVQDIGKEPGRAFLITLSTDGIIPAGRIVEWEARALAEAIDEVKEKMKIPYFHHERFIPLEYSSDPNPRLRSLLIVSS